LYISTQFISVPLCLFCFDDSIGFHFLATGGPGSGKSTAAAMIANHIASAHRRQPQSTTFVATFFFSAMPSVPKTTSSSASSSSSLPIGKGAVLFAVGEPVVDPYGFDSNHDDGGVSDGGLTSQLQCPIDAMCCLALQLHRAAIDGFDTRHWRSENVLSGSERSAMSSSSPSSVSSSSSVASSTSTSSSLASLSLPDLIARARSNMIADVNLCDLVEVLLARPLRATATNRVVTIVLDGIGMLTETNSDSIFMCRVKDICQYFI
jgi:hypothetical protein